MATTPMHFGDSRRRLYGVFHHPEKRAPRAPAVVLCNPFGEEAIRAFRIFRLLAERLAREGHPVLRFDYYGTGDSEGDCAETSLSGFAEDIATAQEEALDLGAASRVVLVGLKAGASAAALAAAKTRPDGLVLWDPVVSGADYLESLKASHIAFIARNFDMTPATAAMRAAARMRGREAMGFAIGDAMASELASFDLPATAAKGVQRVAVIGAGEEEGDIVTAFEHAGAVATRLNATDSPEWNSDEAMNAFVIPAKTLDAIVATLGEWS